MRSKLRQLSSLFRTLLVAAAVASYARVAAADASTAKAKQLYDEGVTNYNLGHYDEALTAFDMAYRIRHDASFLFDIAQCQRQLHRYEDAQRSYRAYLRESPDLPTGTRDQVQKLMTEMEHALDEHRAKQPPTGTQAPGASRPTEAQPTPATQKPAAPPPISPAARSERDGRTLRATGIGVAAFGVAAIVAGGAFYAVAKSANDSVNHPGNGYYSSSVEDRRNTFQTLDIVAFVVGGVAVATGAALYAVGWKRDRRLRLTANAGVGHGGVSLGLSF